MSFATTYFRILSAERLKMGKSPIWPLILLSPLIASSHRTLVHAFWELAGIDGHHGISAWIAPVANADRRVYVLYLPI